jgi:hypothetical protein
LYFRRLARLAGRYLTIAIVVGTAVVVEQYATGRSPDQPPSTPFIWLALAVVVGLWVFLIAPFWQSGKAVRFRAAAAMGSVDPTVVVEPLRSVSRKTVYFAVSFNDYPNFQVEAGEVLVSASTTGVAIDIPLVFGVTQPPEAWGTVGALDENVDDAGSTSLPVYAFGRVNSLTAGSSYLARFPRSANAVS